MLFLLFKAGQERYAIPARRVHEVVPLVLLRFCPGAPGYVAGLLNYRGSAVPVVDLSRLLAQKPSAPRLSTRIILADYASRGAGKNRLIGLMAEEVTQTVEKDESEFAQPGVAAEGAPFLGALCCEGPDMIQLVRIEDLLPEETETLLFAESEKEADGAAIPD